MRDIPDPDAITLIDWRWTSTRTPRALVVTIDGREAGTIREEPGSREELRGDGAQGASRGAEIGSACPSRWEVRLVDDLRPDGSPDIALVTLQSAIDWTIMRLTGYCRVPKRTYGPPATYALPGDAAAARDQAAEEAAELA